MIKDNQIFFNRMHVVLDGIVVAASFMLAWAIKFMTPWADTTPGVTALQYSDAALRDVRVQIATERALQSRVAVRPVLDPALVYEHGGRRETGAVWMAQGLDVKADFFSATELRFAAVATPA